MKKVLYILLAVLFILSVFTGCSSMTDNSSNQYKGWKAVELTCGSIMVPNEWELNEYNGLIYFSQSDNNGLNQIFMLQSNTFSDFIPAKHNTYNKPGHIESNIVSDSFQGIAILSNSCKANSAVYGRAVISVNNDVQTLKYLHFDNITERVDLYIWGGNVDDKTSLKIAESFVMKDS